MVGRIALQELPIVGEFSEFLRFNVLQREGQRHFAERMMVSVAFTVRGNVADLRPSSCFGKPSQQSFDKTSSIIQQPFEGYRL